mmetsp:Transcript_10960/g.11384  ORF Transcript_10960/g.11384 Transcript_10960/m.11384 type:complete len:462 (+) Transcript_10960:54-1439(+)
MIYSIKSSFNNFKTFHFVKKLCSTVTSSSSSSQLSELTGSKPVAYWLFGMCGLVAGMVTVGGVTRLTRSGLSMTDWKIQGSLPPMNDAEWQIEFERYKTFPEWQQRKSMTVDEFKTIYWWEYGHRMMGRSLGVAFILPFTYFSVKKMIPKHLYPRLYLLLGLGGAQGLVGWWMVKSGLEVDPEQKKEIRVSPYRLATHLGMAFTTYGLLLWTALDAYFPKSHYENVGKKFAPISLKFAKSLRGTGFRNLFLVCLTAMSGAYVAGNDAGRAYNTFPKMGDVWIPYEIFDLEPWWKNLFENTAMVQFNHRILAITTYISVSAMYVRAIHSTVQWTIIPNLTRILMNTVATVAGLQVGLGVYTLLSHVPIPIAALHQSGSLLLITSLLCLTHSLGYGKNIPESVKKNVINQTKEISKDLNEQILKKTIGKPKNFPAASLAEIRKRNEENKEIKENKENKENKET